MEGGAAENYASASITPPPKKINKIKKIFEDEVRITRPGPFSSIKVLKTKEGIIALLIFLITGWITTSIFSGFINLKEDIVYNKNFLIFLVLSIFISPLASAFAYTAPLENGLSLAIKKYFSYLGFNLLLLGISLFLIGLMIFLIFIGLCLGLILGLAILFYILYRIFFAPGIIALANESPIDAISSSFEITKKWEGLEFFIVYFIVAIIVDYLDKHLIGMAFEGHYEALIIIILLNLPIFILYASITLFVSSFSEYRHLDYIMEEQTLTDFS